MGTRTTLTFRIPDEGTREYEFDALGDDLYRLAEIPGVFEDADLAFQDVLRLIPAGDGVLELVEVTERGRWKCFDFVLTRAFAESKELATFVAGVEAAGGAWVRELGGCLLILLPPNSIWDPTRELEAAYAASTNPL